MKKRRLTNAQVRHIALRSVIDVLETQMNYGDGWEEDYLPQSWNDGKTSAKSYRIAVNRVQTEINKLLTVIIEEKLRIEKEEL